MPHEQLVNAIKVAAEKEGLDAGASDRIIAWVRQAEEGMFSKNDRKEQLDKIMETMNLDPARHED